LTTTHYADVRALMRARPGRTPDPGHLAVPAGGLPISSPPTLSLVLSRRARREAARASAAARTTDRRLNAVERLLTGLQIGWDAAALALCLAAWVWIAAHRASTPGRDASRALAGDTSTGALTASPLLHPVTTVTGTAMVLVMLASCLLMAQTVNPFYAPPAAGRRLHVATTAVFAVLAVTTVAVIAGAAR
jgi:hypothetical protein